MARLADFALYCSARLWVIVMAFVLAGAVRLAAEAASAPARPEAVVVRIPQP